MAQPIEPQEPVKRACQAGPQPYPPVYPYFVPPPEDEISLLDLLRVLRRRWWLIAFITLVGTGVAVAYALRATPIYRAQAVIAPPQEKQTGAASAALTAFGGLGAEIAGSLGVSLGATDANRLEALLQSHRLIERVVTKHELLPVLFDDKWDSARQEWIVGNAGQAPNIWDAEAALKNGIFSVNNDVTSGVLRLSAEFKDTSVAARILQYFLDELALLLEEDELRKIDRNLQFAKEKLKTATDPAIVAKLQALLSEQVEKAMMAQNVDQFAYELIDPPAVSDKKVKPRRSLICALGFTGSLFAGVFLAFFAEWIARARMSEDNG